MRARDGRAALDTAAPDPSIGAPSGTDDAPHGSAASGDDGSGMTPGGRPILPIWFRSGMLAMLLVALLYAVFGSPDDTLEGIDRGEALASRELHFFDEAGGVVSVRDANSGAELARIASGEDGFIRSVMRGLVRTRNAQGIGQEIPFRLTAWDRGFLSLEDPATGRLVELTAFGPDNVAAFSRLVIEQG